jgi:hypothetical protein
VEAATAKPQAAMQQSANAASSAPSTQPTNNLMAPQNPQIAETNPLNEGSGNPIYNTIFGNAFSTPPISNPILGLPKLNVPQLNQPQTPQLASDKKLKTQVKPAARSIKTFLEQLNGIK